MTEPQVWTLIGVFAAAMFGMITIVSTLFLQVMRAEFGRFDAKFDAKFDAINARLDNLERDMTAVMKHIFGLDRS